MICRFKNRRVTVGAQHVCIGRPRSMRAAAVCPGTQARGSRTAPWIEPGGVSQPVGPSVPAGSLLFDETSRVFEPVTSPFRFQILSPGRGAGCSSALATRDET